MDKVRGHKSRGECRSLTSTACCDGVQSFAVAGRGDGSLARSPWLAQERHSPSSCFCSYFLGHRRLLNVSSVLKCP